jgi:inhibitor of KinA sporulation pathway (predicted exonuclease)
MDDMTFDMVGKISEACKLLNEVEEYVKDLDDRHSICDMKLSDMWHLIENNDVEEWSKGELRNVAKEIKSVCEVRRKVKVNIGLRKIYQDNIGKLNNQVNRAMLLEKLNKAQKSYNSDYTYRVYKEEEINKLVELKKESDDAPISENVGDDLT